MTEKPLVTIYIPTYNRISLLDRAIKSALDQDYEKIEIIVVDDCSTDGTVKYLENMSKANPKVRFFKNEVNSGACISRNKAILNARGEFITGLDDDDFIQPNRISAFLNRWKNINKKTVALTSSVKIKFPNATKTVRRPSTIQKKHLIDNSNFVGSQIFTRTEYLQRIGGFDERMPIMQDYECWLRLLDIWEGASIETIRKETYIVDVSHPHERISHNRLEKLIAARSIIFSKHDFSELEKQIISIDINIESRTKVPFIFFIRKITRNPMLFNIKGTLGLILKMYFPSGN